LFPRKRRADKGGQGGPPIPPASSSSLILAELSIQRGDYESGRAILERRIGQGATDFKTLNLYGVCLSHARLYDNAITIFSRLRESRLSELRVKAGFNAALTQFYQDMSLLGDLSISSYVQPAAVALPIQPAAYANPFARAIETWETLAKSSSRFRDILATYLSFAYLQQGRLDLALDKLMDALDQHETFYVTHYVLGRVFLDLFHLAMEGNDHGLTEAAIAFFEIDPDEIVRSSDGRHQVAPASLLDICLQSFIEGRELSPLSVEIVVGLCRAFMLGGMIEDAHDMLALAESLVPDSTTVLETTLLFYERVQTPQSTIHQLVTRIQNLKRKSPEREVHLVIAPYYLF